MRSKSQRWLLPLIVLFVLFALGSSACKGDQAGTFEKVDDPDAEINVTPDKNKYAHFTVKVIRIGSHYNVGWWARGEFYVKVTLGREEGDINVTGTGFGKAGFDASGGACIDIGGWPIEYNVTGSFSEENCTLELVAEEIWPNTEGTAICLGYGAEVEGPPYSLTLPNIKFTEQKVRTDTTVKDEIVWTNSFFLYTGEGTDKLDCMFSDPPPMPTP
jgi:hypothetical protein